MVDFENSTLPDIIELRDINQTYNNGKTYIIKDFNLLIEDKPNQGQFILLLGPSGCGKSTVLRYITGLQKPSSGKVFIKGMPQTEADRIGMVFQQYSSFPWMTVLENVALGLKYRGVDKKERTEKAMEMIKIVGLQGHEKKFAQYPTLSGGQLQRVAIARSLLVNDEIILMDEPFGALDVKTRLSMQDFLLDLWNEVHPTIILVTHDIAEAVYLGDDIYIMSNAPANITEQIPTHFGLKKNRELKRSKAFQEMVYYIEDKMMRMETKK
ncbi:MAG: ABC transporter ATP-binding protein [Bacteroidales bacterium]|nr:ABC transporter ATP-binding protein [Bacteroidales bacterium]